MSTAGFTGLRPPVPDLIHLKHLAQIKACDAQNLSTSLTLLAASTAHKKVLRKEERDDVSDYYKCRRVHDQEDFDNGVEDLHRLSGLYDVEYREGLKVKVEEGKVKLNEERRQRLIEIRYHRLRNARIKGREEKEEVDEREGEWRREREIKKEKGKASVVKGRTWKDLSRLPENVSLLDLPFGG